MEQYHVTVDAPTLKLASKTPQSTSSMPSFFGIVTPIISHIKESRATRRLFHSIGIAGFPFGTLLFGKILSNLISDVMYASDAASPFVMGIIAVVGGVLGYGLACISAWLMIAGIIYLRQQLAKHSYNNPTTYIKNLVAFVKTWIRLPQFTHAALISTRCTALALAEIGFLVGAIEGVYFSNAWLGGGALWVERLPIIVAGGVFESLGWYLETSVAFYAYQLGRKFYLLCESVFDNTIIKALNMILPTFIAIKVVPNVSFGLRAAIVLLELILASCAIYYFRPFAIDLFLDAGTSFGDALVPALIISFAANYSVISFNDMRLLWLEQIRISASMVSVTPLLNSMKFITTMLRLSWLVEFISKFRQQ